jgi:LysR family cys regulon transcriptional activator
MFDFIELFAPHLTRDVVERALACTNRLEREAMFQGLKLPTR